MAEKRTSKRVGFRKPVIYGPLQPPRYSGYVTDLSDSGIHIQSMNVFKPGTRLYIVIKDRAKEYKLEGIVTSAKKVPQAFIRTVKCGMGIRFKNANEELLKIYSDRTGN